MQIISQNITLDEKILSIIIAILSILSCSPVIFSGFNTTLIIAFSGLYLLFLGKFFFEGKAFLRTRYLNIFVISLILFLYIAIPFRRYDRFSPSVIWFFLFATLLLVNKVIIIRAFYYFSNIIFIICILALIVLMLNAIGVSLPNKIIPREIGGYFTSYYLSVKLSGQDYSFLGLNFYRLNGIFAEPGHFGLLLSMVLFVYGGIIKTLKGKIILFTCLLTFSFGCYVLLFGLLLKYIVLERKIYLIFLIFSVIALVLIVVPKEIIERFFLDKADGTLEDRTSDYFISFYNTYFDKGDILFGNGRDILEINYLRNSDYRGFVIRYGYCGVLLYLFWLISLYWKKSISIQFLGIFYFIVVFLHRSWFIDYFIFLFFLLTLSYNINYKTTKPHEKK